MNPQQSPTQPQTVQPAASNAALATPNAPLNNGQSATPGTAQSSQPARPLMQQATPDSTLSTQTTLLISELRDSMVIMKDGSFRAVVACQSINFDLMSSTEREGIEFSYQNFLNSLNFTTQILIRSQRVDISPYINRLTNIRRNNDNMLLGILIDDYINFIDILSQEANIMDKSFFIIVPYYPSSDQEKMLMETKNLFASIKRSKPQTITRIDRPTYEKAASEINNRIDTIISGLFQIGVRAVRLNTKQLAELYYDFNNPDTAVREPLIDFSNLATTYVKKGEQNA